MPDETLPPSASAQQATNVLEVLKGLIPDYLQQDMKPTTMVPNAAGKVPQLDPYSPLEQAAYGAADLAGLAGPALAPKLAAGALGIGARGLGRLAPDLTAGAKLPSEWMAAFANKDFTSANIPKIVEKLKAKFPDMDQAAIHAAVKNDPGATNYAIDRGYTPYEILHPKGGKTVAEQFGYEYEPGKFAKYQEPPAKGTPEWQELIANHEANKMHSEEFGSSPILPMKNPNSYIGQWDLNTVPREAQWQIPERGKQLGFNVPTHHATRVPTDFNKFMLPETEIGVHFGSPRAALDRIGGHVDVGAARTYPTAIQANNPLELPDLGSWGPRKMVRELKDMGMISPMEAGKILSAEYEKQSPMIREVLKKAGHDSIKYKNSVEDPGSTSYILFNESKKQPGYVTGARAPWAAYHPEALDDPNILRGLAGVGVGVAAAANPDIQNLIKSLGK